MLLEFYLYSVRVADEKLQYSIGTSPLYGEIGNPDDAKFFRNSFNVIGLKAKMTEQAIHIAGIRLLKEFEKAAATRVQKKAVTLAGRSYECVRDFESEDAYVESLRGRQIATT